MKEKSMPLEKKSSQIWHYNGFFIEVSVNFKKPCDFLGNLLLKWDKANGVFAEIQTKFGETLTIMSTQVYAYCFSPCPYPHRPELHLHEISLKNAWEGYCRLSYRKVHHTVLPNEQERHIKASSLHIIFISLSDIFGQLKRENFNETQFFFKQIP